MDKTDHLSLQLERLNEEYRQLMKRTLDACAYRGPGPIGDDVTNQRYRVPAELPELEELASRIERLRTWIGS
jgi:hypothetical protein